MSFHDIEAGLTHPSRSVNTTVSNPQDAPFSNLQKSLSMQVFKMNVNVQGILKKVEQLGTPKDSAELRNSLHNLTETTREMAKRSSDDLKKLTALEASQPHQKTALRKISHDLQLSLIAFNRAQKESAERQRAVIQGVKLAVEDEHTNNSAALEATDPTTLRQAQLLQEQLSPHELAYQESLNREREEEIREIESSMYELAALVRDLAALVTVQGDLIDDIGNHIESARDNIEAGNEELTTALVCQRKAGRRAACLSLILAVIIAAVLLAILS